MISGIPLPAAWFYQELYVKQKPGGTYVVHNFALRLHARVRGFGSFCRVREIGGKDSGFFASQKRGGVREIKGKKAGN